MAAVLQGIFTVPGDGCIPFLPLLHRPARPRLRRLAGGRGRAGPAHRASADLCAVGLSQSSGDSAGGGVRRRPSRAMTDWRPRVAIIGTGGIARVHARLIRELGGELVGGVRPHARRRHRLRPRRSVRRSRAHAGRTRAGHRARLLAASSARRAQHRGTRRRRARAVREADGDESGRRPAHDGCGRRAPDASARSPTPIAAIRWSKCCAARLPPAPSERSRRVGGCYLSQDVFAADKYVWMFSPGTTGGILCADGPWRALARPGRVRHRAAHRGNHRAVRYPSARAHLARRCRAKAANRRAAAPPMAACWFGTGLRNRPIC